MRSRNACILVGIGALATTAPALAQEPESSGAAGSLDATAVNEIIVQARRRDESLQDVPLVVNAVTADAITKLNIRNFTGAVST